MESTIRRDTSSKTIQMLEDELDLLDGRDSMMQTVNGYSDDSDDEAELEKQLEQQIREAQEKGVDKLYDDVSDTQSMRSMRSTFHGIQMIPKEATDADLDNIIDALVLNIDKEKNQQKQLEQKRQLQMMKEQDLEQMQEIITEDRLKEAEELRQLNKLSMQEFLPAHAQTPVATKSAKTGDLTGAPQETQDVSGLDNIQVDNKRVKMDYMEQIKNARAEAEQEKFKFGEEEIIKKFEEDKQQRQAEARQKRLIKLKKAQDNSSMVITVAGAEVRVPDPNKKPVKKISKIDQQLKQFQEEKMKSMLEVERLEMANEDKRSLEVELFRQKEHFKQRNDVPPQIPSVMMDLGTEDSEGGPLAYRPLVASIKPEEPTVDNYQRF